MDRLRSWAWAWAGIYPRIALAAVDAGLVDLPAGELDAGIAALSTHSLRVGLTQDLFAADENSSGVALTLLWSPLHSAALRARLQV